MYDITAFSHSLGRSATVGVDRVLLGFDGRSSTHALLRSGHRRLRNQPFRAIGIGNLAEPCRFTLVLKIYANPDFQLIIGWEGGSSRHTAHARLRHWLIRRSSRRDKMNTRSWT